MNIKYPSFTESVAETFFRILVQYCPEDWASLSLSYKDGEEGASLLVEIQQKEQSAAQYIALERTDAEKLMAVMESAMPFGEPDCADEIRFTMHPDGSYEVQFNK